MNKITVFDTHYTTDNIGDQVIMTAVMSNLHAMFPRAFFTGIPSHDYIGPTGRRALRESDYSFVGGTNILSSHLLWYKQWKLRYIDVYGANKPILMGVGWHKYQSTPDIITRWSYRYFLNREVMHSVRDSYTFDRLNAMGIKNVINTGCPTMWGLTDDVVRDVPTTKARKVIFTLTAYLAKPDLDRALIGLLQSEYDEVYFWPQMHGDAAYLESLGMPAVKWINPNLRALEEVLVSSEIDYVGLRLHCGIFALQHRVRSLTVTIDNRAAEISKDTGLPAAGRDDLEGIRQWIRGSERVQLRLPLKEIERWKGQFKAGVVHSPVTEPGRLDVSAELSS